MLGNTRNTGLGESKCGNRDGNIPQDSSTVAIAHPVNLQWPVDPASLSQIIVGSDWTASYFIVIISHEHR